MNLASDIKKRFETSLGRTIRGESIDLYLMHEYLKPVYVPSREPWVMDIGASGAQMALTAKLFHLDAYDILMSGTSVAGCNRRFMPDDEKKKLRMYDTIMDGPNNGDASREFTWYVPFSFKNRELASYDLAIIRNPDLKILSDWTDVFRRSFEQSRFVMATIREEDADNYRTLLDILAYSGNRPIVDVKTGIMNDTMLPNCWHSVGIFKGSK